jgi:hypothetical protein
MFSSCAEKIKGLELTKKTVKLKSQAGNGVKGIDL